VHGEFGGHGLKFGAEGGEVEAIERPFDAHEEEAGFVVLMLIGVDDVGAEAVEQAGDRGDQALAVGAVDEADGRVGYG